AVEDRGLARAVRADDGKHFARLQRKAHGIHGQQSAKAHAQRLDLEQWGAHGPTSTWWRFIGNRPCGRQTIIRIITSPKISIRYSENSRASSGSTVSTMAAMITPSCEPMPPSTTMARISADSMKVKDSGLTMPWRAAKNAPPRPA